MTATRLTEPYQPARSTGPHQRHVRLAREPAAAAESRGQVRAVIRAWQAPVDPDIAVLLTSDMVTDAIRRGDGETVTLTIGCSRGHLRVDVRDTSRSRPRGGAPAVTDTGCGLVLVAALSAEWGSFRTSAGQATYFTLAFRPAVPAGCTSRKDTNQRRGDVRSATLMSPHERPGSGPYYWMKSSLSYANGNCVEVASLPGGEIGVRNSRDSQGPVLKFTPDEWRAFLGGVRNGEFDGFCG